MSMEEIPLGTRSDLEFAARIARHECERQVKRPQVRPDPDNPKSLLAIDHLSGLLKLIRTTLTHRGFVVYGARTPQEGLSLFTADPLGFDLALIDMTRPSASNLDLSADLHSLRPDLPILYLVGPGKSIARCSIEAHSPHAVLAVPFRGDDLETRVLALLNLPLRRQDEREAWEALVASPVTPPADPAILFLYEKKQAGIASAHVSVLSKDGIGYAFRATNSPAAPYSLWVSPRDLDRARSLLNAPAKEAAPFHAA